jgi:hypothetical protein
VRDADRTVGPAEENVMGLKTAIGARMRFAPLVVASAVLSSAVLGLSATGTLSAFTASIQNQDAVTTGAISMKETDSAGTAGTACTSSTTGTTTCALNKYGTNLLTPNAPTNTTTVLFTNTGTIPITAFSLTPDVCTKTGSASGDICGGITVAVTCKVGSASATSVVAAQTLTAFKNAGAVQVPAACWPATSSGTTASFTFTVTLTGTDNTYQGLTATQPLTWTFQNA